jgi:hypothetical protein
MPSKPAIPTPKASRRTLARRAAKKDAALTKIATAPAGIRTSIGLVTLDAPPVLGAPRVPASFTRQGAVKVKGYYPNAMELQCLAKVGDDLERFIDFNRLVGEALPARADLLAAVELANRWRRERELAEAWSNYARSQDIRAWVGTMKLLAEVRAAFLGLMKGNASVAAAYPALAELFGAPKVIAKKAGVTKEKKSAANAKAKADADKAANAAAVTGAREAGVATGRDLGLQAKAEAAAAKGKVITVNT